MSRLFSEVRGDGGVHSYVRSYVMARDGKCYAVETSMVEGKGPATMVWRCNAITLSIMGRDGLSKTYPTMGEALSGHREATEDIEGFLESEGLEKTEGTGALHRPPWETA